MNMGFSELRTCFLEPVPEVFEAARRLQSAVDAHRVGDRDAAASLIADADMSALRDWRGKMMGPVIEDVMRYRDIDDAPPTLPRNQRFGARMPLAATRREVIERDGLTCRFCGIPVIEDAVRKAFRKAYPSELRWGRRNAERHEAFLCMWLQYDHVLPHSRGGTSEADNVVITCAPCNYGRGEYTVEEVGLIDPRTRPIKKSDWDGLRRFLQPSPP